MAWRIGIDARMIGPVMTGLGRYARGIVAHVPRLDAENLYVVIRQRHVPPPVVAPNVEDAVVDGDIDQPRNLLAARPINRLGLDLYHSLYDFVPPGIRVPRIVVTMHDAVWLEQAHLCFDERFASLKAWVTTRWAWATMPYMARKADRIIAVSHHTRSRAIAVLGLDPARVSVVYHGVDPRQFPPSATGDRRGDGEPPFFLSLGNTKPYKNTRAAVEAFARVAAAHPTVRLFVTGRGDSRQNLGALARSLGIVDRVVFTGPVTHERLLTLLHGAVALVFPSLVEGFGLPLIEAMSAGCPIVGSSAPTVAEICGDAALLPSPADVEAIAAAMLEMLQNASARETLRARGLERAASFTWDRCARETLAVYRETLSM